MGLSAAELLQAVERSDALVRRARRWPNFRSVERHVTYILEHHPGFKRGPIDALRLFKAYRLALLAPVTCSGHTAGLTR